MALILPDGYGIATATWLVAGAGSPGMNVFGYDASALDADTVATTWMQFFEDLLPQLANAVTIENVKTVQRDGLVYSVGEAGPSVSGQGQINTPTVPSNTTWLIRKRSNLMGRENQGRMYLPGVPEAAVNASGEVDPSTRAALQGLIIDGWTVANAAAPMVLLHRNPLDPDDYNASPPTPVVQLLLDSRVATQRRRMR